MNIVHVLTSLKIGGAERFVIDLSLLQRKSNNVKIISFGKEDEPLVEVCSQHNIDIKFINGSITQRTKQLCEVFSSSDVIHFHSPHALKASLFTFHLLVNKKVIYTRHGAHPFNSGSWSFWHSIFKHIVDSVTFVSEDGSNVFHANHNWSNIDSHVIENGIPMPELSALKDKKVPEKVKIGSVGRMVELKNQITLLNAISLLPKELLSKLEIHFFGNGECMEQIQKKAQSIQDAEVFFHGVVTDRNKIYNNIDVLAVTSETEGLSLAIIEAMSYQIPSIGSNVGGNPRLITEDTGYLYSDCFNFSQLSDIIKHYLNNPDEIIAQGIKARQHVESSFSLDACNEKYLNLYSK